MEIIVEFGEINDMLNDAKTAREQVFIMALFGIVTKTCHKDKEDGVYFFSFEDEKPENDKYVLYWIDVIHKLSSFKNIKVAKESNQKLLLFIRHLCKNLENIKISLTSKVVATTKDNKSTTTRLQYISGLNLNNFTKKI